MARYSYSGNKKSKEQNHASEYLPYIINKLGDEIEIVEKVLSDGEEGQVLTANSEGKAEWAEGGGGGSGSAFYDDVQITNILADGVNTTTVTFLLNGEQITNPAWLIYTTDNDFSGIDYKLLEDGTVDIVTGQAGAPEYRLYILLTAGEVRILDLENEPSGGGPG